LYSVNYNTEFKLVLWLV